MLFKLKSTIAALVFVVIMVGCGGGGGGSDTPPAVTPPAASDPVTTSGSIVITGLGDTILVTDKDSVTISGVAESNIGIKHIEFSNDTAGTNGTANGTENWSAQIGLNKGDNKLTFTAVLQDNTKVKINTVLTYYPGLKFTSSLTLSEKVLYKTEAKEVTFTIGIDKEDTQNVKLYEVNKDGNVISEKAILLDDGTLPDEIQKDGVFTAKVGITSNTEGKICYRAGVLSGTTVDYYSEIQCALVTEHYSSVSITTAVKLADDTKSTYDKALAGGSSHDDAMQLAADALKGNADIGTYGYAKDSGIWWISEEGILGGFHPALDGQKAAGEARGVAKPIINANSKRVLTYYPTGYLNQRASYSPSISLSKMTKAIDSYKNVIHSNKGLIISPFINNPNGANFGKWDDYYKPWVSIKNKKSCQLYAAKEIINDGNVTVALSTFILNNNYGYIHISTHGDNFYNGLWSNKILK